MKSSTRFIFGVILIVLGILFLVEQTGLFGSLTVSLWSFLWTFWPLLLIVLGAKLLIEGNSNGGLILLVLGTVLLSTNLFNWNFFSVLWPVLIITIGLSILIKKDQPSVNAGKQSSSQNLLNETVVFWGVDKKVNAKEFKGGEINVAFGGCTIDLRGAKIAKSGAKLHVNCAFGGVEIFVPKDCRVQTNGTGIFGAWEPKIAENDITEPVLEITGGVAFGGVEIK